MSLEPTPVDLGFTDGAFPAGTHMCLIFNSEEERRSVISGFLEAGLRHGERVSYFADERPPDDAGAWLKEIGITGSVEVTRALDTYCPNQSFDPELMLNNLRDFHQACCGKNCQGRVSGEMSWALRGVPGSDRLMEYESRVNEVLQEHPVTAICQYDARKFDGAALLNVLKVHPMMIVRGKVVQNPYYRRPEEFLGRTGSRQTAETPDPETR